MAKQIKYGDEARKSLLNGIEAVSKAVVTTLGPKGRNVAIDRKWAAPNVIHDGVTVAKDIELEDPFENMGAQLVKEASSKTNDNAGDGTTTSTLLASELSKAGMRHVTAGANPMILKKGIEKATETVIGELKKMAKPIDSDEDIENVAVVSAGDKKIGKKIAEALDKVGRDGVVTVEEGKGLEIEIDYKEGMEFDKGYVSPYFVTDSERMEAEVEAPFILLTDRKLSSTQELLPFLEKFVKVSKNLVIIADEVDGDALTTFVVNKLKGVLNVLVVRAPGFGDRRKDMLQDIAVLTGGTVISGETGQTFESVEVSDLGQADKVWADKDTARIIGGKGSPESIKGRIATIKAQLDSSGSEFDTEKLQERLAKLSGGVAVINVGAATETELNDRKERVKDALGATRAAIEEGIVPGGGVALLRARGALDKLDARIADEKAGIDIVSQALETPIKKLIENAGEDDGYIMNKILENDASDYGYNVLTNEFGSMLEFGLVDPLKVTRSALQNASSIAVMVLTTEALITDIPKEENNQAGGMPGMGM